MPNMFGGRRMKHSEFLKLTKKEMLAFLANIEFHMSGYFSEDDEE